MASLGRQDKGRQALLAAKWELGQKAKEEREQLSRDSSERRMQLLESKRQAAERVRSEAGFHKLRQSRESVYLERMRAAEERRRQAADDEALVAERRAAHLRKDSSHKFLMAKQLDPAKVRRAKEEDQRRKSEIVAALRREKQSAEESAMAKRREEAERKKAMHDALLDDRYCVRRSSR
eukprot:CAMPEP_0205883744 /NCGR_PEP_ID=MMETSP1083-20121108/17714_1 /ASSEMBLY_ACC=CAM_ASM_000430 /TAXON_ID=97485 /ORGANISM="Prymnesium parvum, Strain Texoma1" /LENGTH=178 /DNA_ID=CAMNT_0053247031 /DNA_START=9 /DNA_END=545 /DNA_ORIENTATION=+